jgi:hypothetical protein
MSGRHTCGDRSGPSGDLNPQDGVASDVLLARTTPRTLPRNHRTALEDLATPDTPGLGALDRTGKALDAQRALHAERLGQLELGRRVSEPQVRVEGAARQVGLHASRSDKETLVDTRLNAHIARCQGQAHPGHPFLFLDRLVVIVGAKN